MLNEALMQALLNVCFVHVVASPSVFVPISEHETQRVLVREYFQAVPCDRIVSAQNAEMAKRANAIARELSTGDKK